MIFWCFLSVASAYIYRVMTFYIVSIEEKDERVLGHLYIPLDGGRYDKDQVNCGIMERSDRS